MLRQFLTATALIVTGLNLKAENKAQSIETEREVQKISQRIIGTWAFDVEALLSKMPGYDQMTPEDKKKIGQKLDGLNVTITKNTLTAKTPQGDHKVTYKINSESAEKLIVTVTEQDGTTETNEFSFKDGKMTVKANNQNMVFVKIQ